MLKPALELRFPPMAVTVVMGVAMWGVSLLHSPFQSWMLARIALSSVIGLAGLCFVLIGALAFRRARTTFNPLRPEASSTLVSSGVYSITRNPMYLGFLLVLVAWGVFLFSPLALIGPVAFVIHITWFQILPEERVLSEKFGADYVSYQEEVPRWIGWPASRRRRRPLFARRG